MANNGQQQRSNRSRSGVTQAIAGMATILTGAALGLGEVPGAEVVVAAGEALLSTAPSSSSPVEASCPVGTMAPSLQQQLAQLNQHNQQQYQRAMAQLQQQNLQMQQAMAQQINSPAAAHTSSFQQQQQQLAQLRLQNQQQLLAQFQQLQQATAQLNPSPRVNAAARPVASQTPMVQHAPTKVYTSARPVTAQPMAHPSNRLPQARVVAQPSNRLPQARVVAQPSNRLPQARIVAQPSNRLPQARLVAQPSNRVPQVYAAATAVPYQVATPQKQQCPQQHPLEPTAFSGHVCDVCSITISNGNGNMARCKQCDWDICTSCMQQQQHPTR